MSHGESSTATIPSARKPRGMLRSVTRRDPEMMTNWQIEPLIKSDDLVNWTTIARKLGADQGVKR